MDDRNFTFCRSKALAWGVAALTVLLLALASVYDSADLRGWGLACSAAAATAWIRRYFIVHGAKIDVALREHVGAQERAFLCGIEAGRAHAQIPPQRANSPVRTLQPQD